MSCVPAAAVFAHIDLKRHLWESQAGTAVLELFAASISHSLPTEENKRSQPVQPCASLGLLTVQPFRLLSAVVAEQDSVSTTEH